jgi:hypothetical protein
MADNNTAITPCKIPARFVQAMDAQANLSEQIEAAMDELVQMAHPKYLPLAFGAGGEKGEAFRARFRYLSQLIPALCGRLN